MEARSRRRLPPTTLGPLLAPLVGSGMQLVFMALGLVILSCLGVLNPSFRGGFISVGTALFILAGAFSGYFSSRIYRTFGGSQWRSNAVVTATLFPGLLFLTIFILNLFVWAQASSTAIPLGTLFGLVALWLLIQLPLVYAGGWYGFVRAGAYTHPIKANVIPRQIPSQVWYARPVQAALLAGLVPFAVIFIELFFVFCSLWQDKSGYYYVFGFLAVVSTILILAVMETTVIYVYIQLCAEVRLPPVTDIIVYTLTCLAELQLVVAVLPPRRLIQHLRLRILRLLLHQTSPHHGPRIDTVVFRLQLSRLCVLRVVDWYRGVLDGICVR